MLPIIFLGLAIIFGWLARIAYLSSKGIRELPFNAFAGNKFDFLSGIERIEMQEKWSRRIRLNHYILMLFSVICAVLAVATLVMAY